MAEYRKHEAREWAKEKMRGVADVIIPTFTQDLQKLNERAIRHDVEPRCDMPGMIDIIERGLREEALGHAAVPPHLNLPSGGRFFRVMPAVMNESGRTGYKVFLVR